MHGRLGDLRQESRPEERSLPVALGPCSGLGSRFTVSELGSDIADCHSTQLMVDPTSGIPRHGPIPGSTLCMAIG